MKTLAAIQSFYGGRAKPETFGNPDHCAECAEHDRTLRAHDVETISLAELGNPGWDPICYLLDIDQFRYYLPALARLSCGRGDDYYLSQFLFHLNEDRLQALAAEERQLLADFLEALIEQMPEEIERNLDADAALSTLASLRGEPAAG